MKRIIACLCLLTTSGLLSAQDSGSKFDSLLGFQLNSSNLGLIEVAMGKAQQFEVPDGHHEFAICYLLAGEPNIITFNSGSEFGGPEREMLGFSVHVRNKNQFPCSKSGINIADVKVANLTLGITQAEFKNMVGEPLQTETPDVISRIFSSKRQLTSAEKKRFSQYGGVTGVDMILGIVGKFENDVLVSFSVHRVEIFDT